MREDMPRVITERPRIGHERRYRDVRRAKFRLARHLEDLPTHEGMRRPYRVGDERKQFNEHLSPLRRFLEKQVGRLWDEVYSEICKGLRVDSVLHAHVRGHVHDFVEISGGGRWRQLIVCPRSGILLRADELHQVRQAKAEDEAIKAAKVAANPPPIRLAPETDLQRIRGIWYVVTYAVLPKPSPTRVITIEPGCPDPDPAKMKKSGYSLEDLGEGHRAVMQMAGAPRFDVLIRQHIRRGELAPIRGAVSTSSYTPKAPATHYAASKRQAPHALLQRHGLRNVETA
jgi:hypothetical protein